VHAQRPASVESCLGLSRHVTTRLCCLAAAPHCLRTPHCLHRVYRQPTRLPLLQDYIENENSRLDRESQFWSKEIVVRIEYKFCPNLTIIDTPGMLDTLSGMR
jgi:hypothetical protein